MIYYILVGDIKKKTSTAHSSIKKKFNFKNRQHKDADKHAKVHDFGKAMAALQKRDLPIIPENFLKSAKKSLLREKQMSFPKNVGNNFLPGLTRISQQIWPTLIL